MKHKREMIIIKIKDIEKNSIYVDLFVNFTYQILEFNQLK